MKKCFLFLVFLIGASLCYTGNAISYNGVGMYSEPIINYSGQSLRASTLATYPGICFPLFLSNTCHSFFVEGGYAQYTKHSPGTFLDEYYNISFGVNEVDFSNMSSSSGSYLIFNGILPGSTYYDIFLSGSIITFRLWYSDDTNYNLLYTSNFIISSIPSDYSTISWGGFQPKKAIFSFQISTYSKNTILGSDTWFQKLLFQRITSDARDIVVDFTSSGSTNGIKLTNDFSPPGVAGGDAFYNCRPYCSTPSGFSTNQGFYPYNSGSTFTPRVVPSIFYSFPGITSFIDNSSTGGVISTRVFLDKISRFYVDTGSIQVVLGVGGGSDTPGSSTGSSDSFFSRCTSFLDVGCYISGLFTGITSTVSGYFTSFFPSVSFTGQSSTCLSGSTAGFGSGIVSISYFQKVVNMFVLLVPIPPAEGGILCTFSVGQVPIRYRRSSNGLIFGAMTTDIPDTFNGWDRFLILLFSLCAVAYIYSVSHIKHD